VTVKLTQCGRRLYSLRLNQCPPLFPVHLNDSNRNDRKNMPLL
jgi:hypothetical protein